MHTIISYTPQYFISLHKRDAADDETRFSKAEINFLPTVCVLHIVLMTRRQM